MHTRQNNVVACVVPLAGTEPGGAVCDRVVVVVLVSGTEFAPFMVPVTVGYKYNWYLFVSRKFIWVKVINNMFWLLTFKGNIKECVN